MMHIDGYDLPKTDINATNDEYNITIDNIDYTIPISNIYEFMTLSNNKFQKLCTDKTITGIYGMPKEHFVFACINYITERKTRDNRFQNPLIIRRFSVLLHYELIDFEAVNKDITIVDKVYDKVELNKEVKNQIIKDLPKEYSKLEKAIYIYIKMCQIFTYDREFFSQNQTYQKELSYISTISLENLEIVCFEFAVIYGQLLAELGINFRSYYGQKQRIYELRSIMDDGELAYGQKHAFTEFRVGKFLVDVDAMESILEGDLINVKINKPLNGIQCINSNRITQKEFSNVLDKVYKNFDKTETKKYELESQYQNHLSDLSLQERITILFNKINSINLTGLDAYGYILELKRTLFNKEEQTNNFSMSIIRTNEPQDRNKNSDIVLIISINVDDFSIYPENTKYYILYPDLKLEETNEYFIERCFNNKEYEYINDKKPVIPNINPTIFKEEHMTIYGLRKQRGKKGDNR